jgi:hypothetical protein
MHGRLDDLIFASHGNMARAPLKRPIIWLFVERTSAKKPDLLPFRVVRHARIELTERSKRHASLFLDAGRVVLDVNSRSMAGCYRSSMLAEPGAETIRIEPPEGDWVRTGSPDGIVHHGTGLAHESDLLRSQEPRQIPVGQIFSEYHR